MTDTKTDTRYLGRGLRKLHIPNPESTSKRLLEFCNLVLEHSRGTNLVGAKSLEELIGPIVFEEHVRAARGCARPSFAVAGRRHRQRRRFSWHPDRHRAPAAFSSTI